MKISHDSHVQLPYLFSYAFLVQRYTCWPEKVTCDQQPPFKRLNSIIGHFNFNMIMFSCLNHANFCENSYLEKKCWMLRFFFGRVYVIISFYVQWYEVRGNSSFCWSWWNYWPSLFELYFHNAFENIYCFLQNRFTLKFITKNTTSTTNWYLNIIFEIERI